MSQQPLLTLPSPERWPTWESWEDWCTTTAPPGVERIEPPTIHRGRRARRSGEAPADLRGVVDGVPVLVEVKHHSNSRNRSWPLDNTAWKPHQKRAMRKAASGGAVVGLLLCYYGSPLWLPWDALSQALWDWATADGPGSLSPEWLQLHARPIDPAAGWWAAASNSMAR